MIPLATPAHPGTRLVCEGSGRAEVPQICLDECAAGHCRGVYSDEGFEAQRPARLDLGGRLGDRPGARNRAGAPAEDGRSLAARLTQVETSRDYASNFAQSPELDLTSATEPVLHFLAYLLTETGKSGFNVWVRSDERR